MLHITPRTALETWKAPAASFARGPTRNACGCCKLRLWRSTHTRRDSGRDVTHGERPPHKDFGVPVRPEARVVRSASSRPIDARAVSIAAGEAGALRVGPPALESCRPTAAVRPFPNNRSALLKALLAHPGELVTRDELRRELWPEDTFVDFERGLNAAVKRLRDALGDSAERPAFIETIPRRGYRLVAAVEGMQPAGRQENGPPAISAGVTHVEDAGEFGRPPNGRVPWFAAWSPSPRARRDVRSRLQASCSGVDRHPLRRCRCSSSQTFDVRQRPRYRPDVVAGREVHRVRLPDRAWNFDIWIQPADGGEPSQLTHSPEADTQPTWSPDGSDTIVYRSGARWWRTVCRPRAGWP